MIAFRAPPLRRAPPGSVRRRPRIRYAAVLLALVAALLAALIGTGQRNGSTPTLRGATSLAPERPISSYRITYRVTRGEAVAVEERAVRRPWFGRSTTTPVGGSGEWTEAVITNETGRWIHLSGERSGWFRSEPGQQQAVDDLRPVPALDHALREGLAEVVGESRVLGRRCTVVRTGAPLGLPLQRPTAREHAVLYIDETGIVLRQDWVLDGRLVERRMATSFEPDAALPDETFRAVPLGTPGTDTALAFPVEVASSDTEPPTLPGDLVVPVGFRRAAEVLFVHKPSLAGREERTRVLNLVRAADDTVLEVRVTTAAPSSEEPAGRPVALGDGRFGHLELVLGRSTLSVRHNESGLVRLSSSDPAVLLAVAQSLGGR